MAVYVQFDNKKNDDDEQRFKDLIYRFRKIANETQLYEGYSAANFDSINIIEQNLLFGREYLVKGTVYNSETSLRKGPEFFHSYIINIVYYRFKANSDSFDMSFKKTMCEMGYLVSGYLNQFEYVLSEIKGSKKN